MSYTVADPIYYNKPVFRFRRQMAASKKNLFGHFIEEDSICPSEDAIKVFLRLKPSSIETDIIQVLDSKTVLFKMPQEFMQARNKLNMPDQHKYSFSHIYGPNTTQSQIYTGCVAPLIKDLFNGQHCLLFTYGTTNAGKTFTVLGNGDHPGILPRTLTTVFKTISGKEYNNDRIMPDKFNSAIELTDSNLSEERKFKEGILTWNHNKSQPDSKLYKTSSTVRSSVDEIFGESVFREMQKRLTNDTSVVEYSSDSDDRFSVWVTFAEIYNEAIYDLLQPVVPNAKRKQLKLGQHNHKNYYIKGLRHVCVESEEEAYKVLMFGKTNLQVAATGMNSTSSRSHCIFTIKLIKSPNVEHPEQVVVSSFSICDLAGAERQKKTLNVGLRLKESQNINCSLHVLSRCFNIIRENQINAEPKMIPFRDSKLTQLFRHALTGKESVTMIVNVNSDHQLCEETQHVLKASAIAKHIVVQPRKARIPKRDLRKSTFSQIIVNHNRSTLIRWDSCVKAKATEPPAEVVENSNVDVKESRTEQYENLLSVIEELKAKLKEERAKHSETKQNWGIREEEIRKEMKEELSNLLERKKETDDKISEVARKEVNMLKKRRLLSPVEAPAGKLKRVDSEDVAIDQFNVLQEEVKVQQKQIDGLTDLVNILREEKKQLGMELTLAQFNLGYRDRDIADLKAKIEMFRDESTLHEKYLTFEKEMEEKLLARDRLLDEAREDLLEELRAKDDLEDEITKLEKELTEKEEDMLSKAEDMKEELNEKEDQIEYLEAKIENMGYVHEDELKKLKTKCMELEEEISRLKLSEDQSLKDSTKESLEKEISKLTLEREELLGEKSSLEEVLARQNCLAKEHEEELSKTIDDLKHKLKVFDEQVRQLNEIIKVEQQSMDSLREELNSKIAEAESYKSKLDKKDEEYILMKTELENKITELDSLREELNSKNAEAESYKSKLEKKDEEYVLMKTELENKISELMQRIEEMKKYPVIGDDLKLQCLSLQKALEERSQEIDSLEKTVEALTNEKKKTEEEYVSEINTLQQSYKKQLQETTRLWESQSKQGKEHEELKKQLSKFKSIMADLSKSLKTKEHELECCRSQMMGYEKMVPTLQSEFDVQRKELVEYKEKCEDLKETIINMEQELNSFQANQKEIIGKYEDNLKKTKDENDSLKKEVARVTTTFYKSTPTPKKILENQIEDLKTQIENLNIQLGEKFESQEKLLKENEALCSKLREIQTLRIEEQNKENESDFKQAVCQSKGAKPRSRTLKLDETRGRAQSCEDEYSVISDSDVGATKAKSAGKTMRRKITRAAAVVPSIIVTDDASETSGNKATETKKLSRKKLFEASTYDVEQFEDDESALDIPQDSPRTFYRRTLRNRNK